MSNQTFRDSHYGLIHLPNKQVIEDKTKVNASDEICTVGIPLETGTIRDDPSCPSSSATGSPRLCWEADQEGQYLGGGVEKGLLNTLGDITTKKIRTVSQCAK